MLLRDDHHELSTLLDEAIAAMAGADSRSAFEKLDLFWARLAMHIRAEHLHLFPTILSHRGRSPSASSDLHDKIDLLRQDHDFFMHELADAIKAMRARSEGTVRATQSEIGTRLVALRGRLAEHDRIEEAEIYPIFEDWDSRRDSDELAALMKKELDNLPPRFQKNHTE